MTKAIQKAGKGLALGVALVGLSLVAGCASSSSSGSTVPASPAATSSGGSTASPTTDPLALTGTGKAASSLTGHWTVASGSIAGYRVTENFLGQSSDAVARTSALSGGTDVTGTAATALTVTADLTQCKGIDGHVSYAGFNRDNVVKTRILNLGQNPNATLTADSINLPAGAVSGTPVDISGSGNFTLKGVTKPVTFKMKGQAEGDQKLEIAGAFTINLPDYGIQVPSVPFTSAGSTGTVEVDLFLTK